MPGEITFPMGKYTCWDDMSDKMTFLWGNDKSESSDLRWGYSQVSIATKIL